MRTEPVTPTINPRAVRRLVLGLQRLSRDYSTRWWDKGEAAHRINTLLKEFEKRKYK